jgi:hypothetical protein
MADGWPRLFKKSVDPTVLVELITRAGNEVVDGSDSVDSIEIP